MRKGTIFLITLTCLTLMSAQSVSAQKTHHIRAHVNKVTVIVRNKPVGFALGILFGGASPDAFVIKCVSPGKWAYGNARGNTRRTGWVPLSDLDLPDNQEPYVCGSGHVIRLSRFMSEKNSKTCHTSSGAAFNGESICDGSRTTVKADTPYYRNFNFRTDKPRPDTQHDKMLAENEEVYWRYVTRRGNFVLLRRKPEDTWGFVPKDHLNSFPKYLDCQVRDKDSCCDPKKPASEQPGCFFTSKRQPDPIMAPRANASARLSFRNDVAQMPKITAAMYRNRDYATNHWKGIARFEYIADDGDGAALSLTQDASSDPVVTGSSISYTITVFNNGESAASPFSVLADLPAQTSFVACAATGGGVCSGSGNNRTVMFDSLAPDEWVTVTLTATVNCSTADATVITSTATLSCSSPGECPPPDEPSAIDDEDTEGNNEDFRETVFTTVSDPGPSITAPPAVTAFTGPNATFCGTFVSDSTLGNAIANDNCPGVSITRSNVPAGNLFRVGQTIITYTATDQSGHTASATQLVTVIDNTPPVISGVSVDKPFLWPSDHKMVAVTVNYIATDNCGSVTNVLAVMSNEPVNGLGDGDTAPDWEVLDANHVRLREERSGRGAGRLYTITITSTDSAGNSASKQIYVTVPHDQRR